MLEDKSITFIIDRKVVNRYKNISIIFKGENCQDILKR